MEKTSRHLLVLSCSSTKLQTPETLPAVNRYDGPMYRVLRSFLRESRWPASLSVAVLSARYGLIGGLTPIEYYDQKMDRHRAAELENKSTETLIKWSLSHKHISLVLGKNYLPALNIKKLNYHGIEPSIVEGPIGIKLNCLHGLLHSMKKPLLNNFPGPMNGRPLYFLPDWDDMLDVHYDFKQDVFSKFNKKQRVEQHCIKVMQPYRICDGVLVSLAQHFGSKGVLKKFAPTDFEALAPRSLREQFGLSDDQWVFGDCGAFSYVNEPRPTITTEQALSFYQLYGFDFGASVDHIPVSEVLTSKGKTKLSQMEQRQRVQITKENAAEFINLYKQRKCTFIPVGVIQGLTPDCYGSQLQEYIEMGYDHIGIGGLVFRSDAEIIEIVRALDNAKAKINRDVWIHLFGIFRPKIQNQLREMGITSFDSASYFRKAWMRSDQNYLGSDGKWYAAIRVPMTSDPRTRIRLQRSRLSMQELEKLEREALQALHRYGERRRSLASTLKAIARYDSLLERGEGQGTSLLAAYERTLAERPWEKCDCPVCSTLGIDVLIFRGYNRNKRRGAHNTMMLYRFVSSLSFRT